MPYDETDRMYIDSLKTAPRCGTNVFIVGGESAAHMIARWGSLLGQYDEVRMDAATHSLQTVAYEHHEIHAGSHYFVVGYQDLAINNVLDFTWLMPDTTRWTHWTWDIDTESETLWQVYEGAVATNPLANPVTPLNSNRNSLNTSGTTMRFELHANLAAANADTNVGGAVLLESGISGSGRQTAGNAERGHEIILAQNTLYCLRATATAAGYINFNMQWYEHTHRD
jgi:hypothetical protein